MKLFTLGIALVLGNFLWQMMVPAPDWQAAVERSHFQAIALFAAWLIL